MYTSPKQGIFYFIDGHVFKFARDASFREFTHIEKGVFAIFVVGRREGVTAAAPIRREPPCTLSKPMGGYGGCVARDLNETGYKNHLRKR